jgi:predicted nucleic acid-binding protein
VTRVVIDASVVLSWCFEDEASDESYRLLDLVERDGAAAPSFLLVELANVLWAAERRSRVTAEDAATFVSLIDALGIAFDPETASRALWQVRALARTGGVSVYDATYLELAQRLGLPLATRDEGQIAAALRLGIAIERA